MAVRSFTLRVSGNASLEDNSVVSFLENWDSRFLGDLPQSNLSFRTLYPAKKGEVESLVPYTIEGGKITPSGDPTAAAVDVTSVSMVITGEVSFDDNTVLSFEFEVRDDGSVFNHTGDEGESAWLALSEDATANSLIAQMFTALYSTDDDPITVALVAESVSSESTLSESTSSPSESSSSNTPSSESSSTSSAV